MKNRKLTQSSSETREQRREARLRRRVPDSRPGKAPTFEEDDSFEEAFERDADDVAFADVPRM
jgi:hypothetical protein